MSHSYHEFLLRKSQLSSESGFEPLWLPQFLFDFQRALVGWAIRKGRAAIFADTGMGKTPIELVWAQNVVEHTNGRVLILAPLAVGAQTMAEGEKFGIGVARWPAPGKIVTANYQRLHQITPDSFTGVVCDESGILKHFDGQTRKAVTRFLLKVPYRLLATATPAPNDWSELGTSSEALGELTHTDMLETFFRELDWDERRRALFNGHFTRRISLGVLDTMTGRWRLKGHAALPFWRWVASWARACRKPSDLGPFDDSPYVLPPLVERDHVVKTPRPPEGMLFNLPAISMRQELDERRRGISPRCEKVAELVSHREPAVVWCQLNSESAMLAKLIPDAVEITGAQPEEEKEERLMAFVRQETGARALISKAKICGFGLNLQHCAHVVSFASHSFESHYQSVRRCWRYGQMRPVTVDVIWTEGETRIKDRLRRKCERADEMFAAIVSHMRDAEDVRLPGLLSAVAVPGWLNDGEGRRG